MPDLPPIVGTIVDDIDKIGDNTVIQGAVADIAPKIPAKARNVIYIIGVVLGGIATVGTAGVAFLSGKPALYAGSAIAIAYALSNLLAKLHVK